MDISRERGLRRFGMDLQQRLDRLDARVKIFKKNHSFNNRLIIKDLKQIRSSGRKMAEGDLDNWDSKRTARSIELAQSCEKKMKIVPTELAHSERKNSLMNSEISERKNSFKLPQIIVSGDTSVSKVSSSRRESLVLPKVNQLPGSIAVPLVGKKPHEGLPTTNKSEGLNFRQSNGNSVHKDCLDVLQPVNPEFELREKSPSPTPEVKNQISFGSKWKILAKTVRADTENRESIEKESPEQCPSQTLLSFRSVNSENQDNQTLASAPGDGVAQRWRRLSVISNMNTGRRFSIRKRSMTSNQAVLAFLDILNSKKHEEDEEDAKKYDLSYLKECRYLRHRLD
ncbi:hypothetical protein SNE40_011247 [Patella caerulea]|uniref:Uncharacterized protein n=1 Tax=Patella caerulea TaxID=87958 RepID=A0AAN8JJB9_PATCE